MSCMSQNFRLLHLSNLSVRNFRIFLLMYPGPLTGEQRGHQSHRAATQPSSRLKPGPRRTRQKNSADGRGEARAASRQH